MSDDIINSFKDYEEYSNNLFSTLKIDNSYVGQIIPDKSIKFLEDTDVVLGDGTRIPGKAFIKLINHLYHTFKEEHPEEFL